MKIEETWGEYSGEDLHMETWQWDLRRLLEMLLGPLIHHENIWLLEYKARKAMFCEIKDLLILLQTDSTLHLVD